MEKGSLVIMTKDMPIIDRIAIMQCLRTHCPYPSDKVFIVTDIATQQEAIEMEYDMGIFIDGYPILEDWRVPFDAKLFTELLPPNLNVDKLLEEAVESAEIP